jgi:tRNA G10  N-methylase Trm11
MLGALLCSPDRPANGDRLAGTALSARSTTSHLSHDIHYYKAKFFPRLARSMLNICARRLGDGPHRVLDPFVGSGTTLLEAATLGIPSVGLDIDPLSVLISQAKLAVAHLESQLLAQEADRAIELLGRGHLASPDEEPVTFPRWLMANRKMTAEIARQLSQEIRLLQGAVAACDPRVRSLFRVLLSDAIARRVRMRFLGTGVGRFSLTLSKTPAPQILSSSLKRYVKTVAALEWLRETVNLEFADVQVLEADARRLPEDLGTFDILVSSPPYLPASSGRESYAKARAPSLIALEMVDHSDVDRLVDNSVGSMVGGGAELAELTDAERNLVEWLQQDSLRAIKAEPTARYFTDMRRAFVEMARVLRPGALAVVVSGKQSTFYNFSTREALYIVPSAELLAEEAERAGLIVDVLHDIQLQKANMNARPRSLDDYYETLIFLRKPP